MPLIEQTPPVGEHILRFRGDVLDFFLKLDAPLPGRAYLRTNLGRGKVRRNEVIAFVEDDHPLEGQDWRDLPMLKLDPYTFCLRVALLEVGHFEAISFFEPAGGGDILWPGAQNVAVNVEPADYCCGNTIYCAFPRQFGPGKRAERSDIGEVFKAHGFKELDDAGYTVIPPSGTFRGMAKELDTIIGKLKCRVIHLLPINPTPTVYARMGRFGSPYAALDFTAVDPALAEFDTRATPLEQFLELVDAIHQRDAKIIIDIAINHTGWASKLHETHPEWFVRRPDGEFVSPGAWGVVWGDLCELDHSRRELWRALADAFLTWCARGVDGFRCDAGYMIPYPAWEYIIAKVRRHYPKTIFLLEGLGGDPRVTFDLLNGANMDWAYSELFQNYSKEAIEGYVRHAQAASRSDGVMVHYAETHDNPRLAATSRVYAKMRVTLCALASSNGAFGFANGVEWFATEKIDVHQASGLNWGATPNMVEHIARLNSILLTHPAFQQDATLEFFPSGHPSVVAFLRLRPACQTWAAALINLDCERPAKGSCSPPEAATHDGALLDLLTGAAAPVKAAADSWGYSLLPGESLLLDPDPRNLQKAVAFASAPGVTPPRAERQRAMAMALDIVAARNGSHVISDFDLDADDLQRRLHQDPLAFCAGLAGPGAPPRVVVWRWPSDLRREVMVPPGHTLLALAPARFRAAVEDADGRVVVQRDSLRAASGEFFAALCNFPATGREHLRCSLRMTVFSGALKRGEGPLMLLASNAERSPSWRGGREVRARGGVFLSTNGRGGMCRARLRWGELDSRYDALLAANLHPEYPEDRRIMWTRARLWLQHRGRSEPIDSAHLKEFNAAADGAGEWTFHIPVGDSKMVDVTLSLAMRQGHNALDFSIRRGAARRANALRDLTPVRIVLRPDLEDRTFHQDTKAASGPERIWPGATRWGERWLEFAPTPDACLRISANKGRYHPAAEWYYCIWHEEEARRGLEPTGDLFSPGWFEFELCGGESVELRGVVAGRGERPQVPDFRLAAHDPLEPEPMVDEILAQAVKHYIVRRGELKTVIAGYPWFLDWGRDTLICARGLLAAGLADDVAKILLQFARFAENGTIPNMICGGNASNRDTSDAPLWLFTACADYCACAGGMGFLETPTRTGMRLVDELVSIAEGYMAGTPNGVKADPESLLVFSPSHFTWMDTNFPAGTPREGYPIEIQALWRAALAFLHEATGERRWGEAARQVEESIVKYFVVPGQDWLADCLHARPGEPAAKAQPDDHLRCNQLFAVTLGAVRARPLMERIVGSSQELLVPGGIRTLADRPVRHPLPIRAHGPLLNDPNAPYWGRYEGDEDTRRKPAYHNGTAWTWPFPSWCEAYFMLYGEEGRATAKAVLSSATRHLAEGCFWQVPEILDGDAPHHPRGCDAQAWGVTELLRVWRLLRR